MPISFIDTKPIRFPNDAHHLISTYQDSLNWIFSRSRFEYIGEFWGRLIPREFQSGCSTIDLKDWLQGKGLPPQSAHQIIVEGLKAWYTIDENKAIQDGQAWMEHLNRLYEKEITEEQLTPSTPEQTRGLTFILDDDHHLAIDPNANPDGNDYNTLRDRQAVILDALKKALNAFGLNNNAFGALVDRLVQYEMAFSQPVETINFDTLYAEKIRIEKAYALSLRKAQSPEFADLDDNALIETETFLSLQRAFFMASAIGMELVADTENFDKSPAELKQLRADMVKLGNQIEKSQNILKTHSKDLVVDVLDVETSKSTPQGLKQLFYAVRVARNLAVVSVKLAGLTAASTAAAAVPIVGPYAATATTVFGGRAILNSPSCQKLFEDSKAGKSAAKQTIQYIQTRFRNFITNNFDQLNRASENFDDQPWFAETFKDLIKSKHQNQISILEPTGSRTVIKEALKTREEAFMSMSRALDSDALRDLIIKSDTAFVELIATLVNDFQIRQSEIAEALGLSPATISSWKTGRSVPRGFGRPAILSILKILVDKDISAHQTSQTKFEKIWINDDDLNTIMKPYF